MRPQLEHPLLGGASCALDDDVVVANGRKEAVDAVSPLDPIEVFSRKYPRDGSAFRRLAG